VFGRYGLGFVFGNDWDVSRSVYHGAALVVGTLITSAIALVIGVPVAVTAALFVNELCPRRLRSPLAVLVDLLAAVPSVVYGLWGVFVLAPKLLPAEKWFAGTFSFIPWAGGGTPALYNYFIAGVILAIMILPIVSAIAREVIATVPAEQKEAALALGATRWEMIRVAVLPYSRSGITGGAMLGLGRAIGETIAVVLVIGNAPTIGRHLFSQGYTLAAVIANEFGEAANTPVHSSALFAAGLVLFVLTLIVNVLARGFVARGTRGRRGTGGAGLTVVVAGREG
jgi:phosphate ABC transporter permease protein PstC